MQYEVPQFIDVEDKIFGPFTWRQFLFIVGGIAGSYALWRFIPVKFFAVLLIIPVAALAAALAFYRPNERPFIFMVEACVKYIVNNKRFLWKKEGKEAETVTTYRKEEAKKAPDGSWKVPTFSKESKLQNVKWSLDVGMNADNPDDKTNYK